MSFPSVTEMSCTSFVPEPVFNKVHSITKCRQIPREQCWINVYTGAPHFIYKDAGTNFPIEQMRSAASSMGIVLKSVLTEGRNRIGTVERSHAILRFIYNMLKMDLSSLRRKERQSMAFRAINDAPARGSRIYRTMLVFSILPKIPGAGFLGSMAERANIIRVRLRALFSSVNGRCFTTQYAIGTYRRI